jgi:hypothetical protein
MVILCQYCNKEYSSYSSRSNHIKKYHSEQVSQKLANVSNDVSQKLVNVSKVNLYKCKYCENEYKHCSSKSKHEKSCQSKDNTTNLEKIIQNQNKQLEELKELIQKSLKIHPKTLQKINNQLINNTYINGDVNNYVVQLGYEDLDRIMTEKEKIAVLNKYGNCLTELVKIVHVSDIDKYKPFKNMYITNLQNNIAYKYDDNSKKFIAVTKSDLLDSIIDNRLSDIESFHEDYKEKITPFTSKQINAFLARMNDEKVYKENKKEEIKLVIYNGREEIINQIKENNPDLNIFT